MSVRLRLQRHGATKRPFYRVVAADQRARRDGRFIENLGTYDPLHEPPVIRLNGERIDYWLNVGAQPSDTVRSLIRKMKRGDNVIDLSKEGAEAAAMAARAAERKAAQEAARQEAAAAAQKAIEEAEATKKAEEEAKAKAEAEAAAAKEAEAAAEESSEEAAPESTEGEGGEEA